MNTISLFLSLFVVGGAAQISPAFYQNAVRAYHQKKYAKASKALAKILVSLESMESLEKKKQAGSKKQYFLVLGQCDMLYYLAQIAKQQGRMRLACRRLQDMSKRLRSVPKQWTSWAVQPHLLVHMRDGQTTFAQTCPRVSSTLNIAVTPQGASIAHRSSPQEAWAPLKGTAIATRLPRIYLRIQLAGYVTKLVQVTVPRWQQITFSATLLQQKKPKIVAIRRPPVPPTPKGTPFYKTWWFWTVTGVVVVGGVAAAVAIPLTDQAQIQLKPRAW